MTWTQQIAAWWIDFFFATATVLLAVVLIAGWVIRQPVQRMAMAWSTMIALVVLAVCCAAPGWPRVAIFVKPEVETASALPTTTVDSPSVAVDMGSAPTVPQVSEFRPRMEPLRPPVDFPAVGGGAKREFSSAVAPSEIRVADAAEADYSPLLTAALLSGALTVVAWLILGQLRAWRLCRRAIAAPDFAQQELRLLVGPQGRLPKLLVEKMLLTAAAMGLWRPTILLPTQAVAVGQTFLSAESCRLLADRNVCPTTNASDSQISLRALLAHEWAHIQRGDLWLLALSRLLLVVLFAHPLFWLLRRRIRADQELLADALAAQHCGRHEYAETLVAWARHQPHPGSRLNWALGIWERPSQLSRRIAMLLNERMRLRMVCSRGWRIANLCAAMALVGGLSLLTLNPAPPAKAEPIPTTKEVTAEAEHSVVVAKNDAPPTEPPLPKVTITGTCLDEDYKPVANARVRLIRVGHSDTRVPKPTMRIKFVNTFAPGDKNNNTTRLVASDGSGAPNSQRVLQETRSDEVGRFQFAEIVADKDWQSQADRLFVVVQSVDKGTEVRAMYITRDSDDKQIVNPLSISLQGASSLQGRITNSDGKPVAGALVTASMNFYLAKPLPGMLCAVTDAEGHFAINDVPPFDVADIPPQAINGFGAMEYVSAMATIEHADYAPGFIEYPRLPARVDHVLQRPAKLHGQVVLDESGKAAEKTTVTVTHENGLALPLKTDEQGMYSIAKLLPGKYTVEAKRSDRLVASQTIALAPGERAFDLRLKNGGIIKGRLVDDATGKAPDLTGSGAGSVNVRRMGDEPEQARREWVEKDCSFLVAVKPGRNLLLFPHPAWQVIDAERWIQPGIEVAEGQTVEIELRLRSRNALNGGWQAVFADAERATAIAKGETPPPARPEPVPPKTSPLEAEEEESYEYLVNYPTELLPKKPMSEAMLMKLIKQPDYIPLERKTIDGKKCITMICIDGSPLTKAELAQSIWLEQGVLAHFDKFPHLQRLYLIGGPLADDWLEPLREHENLQSLDLIFAQHVTSLGISHLGTLPNLTHLQVIGFKLDNGSLREIAKFPKLDSLIVGGVFTDAGLAHLREKSQLKSLNIVGLGDSKITDESFRHIAGLTNLEELQVANSKEIGVSSPSLFTDEGLKHLAGMTKLRSLFVCGEKITDAGLVRLGELKNLKELNLDGTSVTQEGIDKLKKSLPELKVTMPKQGT